MLGTDSAILEAVNRGEFKLNGFRNRDLQRLLYALPVTTPEEKKKRSTAVTGKLRLLRAHGLIQKVSRTHRYVLTQPGQVAITAILAARHATVAQLTKVA